MQNLDTYNSIRESIGFCDVLLFSGKNGVSDIIKDITLSEYSHCAVAIWMDPIVGGDSRLFCVESTTLNTIPDAFDGTLRVGVQLVALGQRLEGYDGKCWLLRQKAPLTNDEKMKCLVWMLQQEVNHVPYDLWGAAKASLGLPDNADLDKLFCSELVTKVLQLANRVPETINPSAMLPKDVAKFEALCCPEIILDEK